MLNWQVVPCNRPSFYSVQINGVDQSSIMAKMGLATGVYKYIWVHVFIQDYGLCSVYSPEKLDTYVGHICA